MNAIEAKRRTDRRRRPDNADEISARANDGDAGQGPPTKREIEQGRLNNE